MPSMSNSPITTILFDLDGTLLPMDQKKFMEAYLVVFAQKCRELELPVERSVQALNTGFLAMLSNDGSMSNEKRFWQVFSEALGMDVDHRIADFTKFYSEEFTQLKVVSKATPISRNIVSEVRSKGYRTVLATTPVFPRPGTLERISWAGMEPDWFELITTYEDFSYAKPNLGYYGEILNHMQVSPQECLMVGNDVSEDLVAQQLGMQVFLVTDHLINRSQGDTSAFMQGSLADFYEYCKTLEPR